MQKNKIKIGIILIVSIMVLLIFINILTENKVVNSIYEFITGKAILEQESTITCIVYNNTDTSKLKTLIQVNNNAGIEYVENQNEAKISCNGKQKISFDYELEMGTPVRFLVKAKGKTIEEKYITITQEDINNQVQLSINTSTIEVTEENIEANMQVFYSMKNKNDKTYYYNGENYVEYTDEIVITTASGNIKLRKVDQAGNILDTTHTYNLSDLSFVTFEDETWNEEKASIRITKVASELSEGEEVEYSIIGKNNISWRKLENTEEINDLYHGDAVLARIVKDNIVKGTSISKNILDKTPPKDAIVTYTKIKSGEVSSQITDIDSNETKIEILAGDIMIANVEQIDEESGIDITKCKWIYSESKALLGTNPNLYTGVFESNIQEIECKLTGKDGARYLHVLSCDKAGIYHETVITDKVIIVTGGEGIDVFEANGVSAFSDVSVSDSSWINTYKENYKVGALALSEGAWGIYRQWYFTIDVQNLLNDLDLNKISKFNMDITYQGVRSGYVDYTRIYVKYERRNK